MQWGRFLYKPIYSHSWFHGNSWDYILIKFKLRKELLLVTTDFAEGVDTCLKEYVDY